MIITLIGYRGSGKTSVAAGLAERLGFDWVDADVVIEQTAGRSIREIFAAEGEPGFRQRERAVICELLRREKLVLAAGGGAILDADTRRDLKLAGPVVWLQASVDVLAERISGDPTTAERRPNLAGGGRAEIERVLAIREPLYRECATFTIFTDRLSVAEIIDRIAIAVAARRPPGVNR
ncbi:MAG: shikimate kinase [Planctomycetes bacterium]|nr:shikimate kinase [Planctomycetota bacterium]